MMLSLLHHQNLVNLVGYCADGDQRILVYEYMQNGSLEDHLLGIYTSKTLQFIRFILLVVLQLKFCFILSVILFFQ